MDASGLLGRALVQEFEGNRRQRLWGILAPFSMKFLTNVLLVLFHGASQHKNARRDTERQNCVLVLMRRLKAKNESIKNLGKRGIKNEAKEGTPRAHNLLATAGYSGRHGRPVGLIVMMIDCSD